MTDKGVVQTRHLMWIDIVTSGLVLNKLGLEEYGQRLEVFYELIDRISQNFSVQMVDTLGDGISVNSYDVSIDSLIQSFFVMREETQNILGFDIKGGIHTGEVYVKDVTLNSGICIPLVAGAINEAARLETLCKVNKTNLLLSPEAYANIKTKDLKDSFILSKGSYRKKNSFFVKVYRYAGII